MDESTKQRPIPKPRRKIVIESNQEKLPYENVEIIKPDNISRNNDKNLMNNRNIITEINNLNISQKVNNVPTPAPRKLDRTKIVADEDVLDYRTENVLKKSVSCSTISSSSTQSSVDADNVSGKYKTSSPGDLFKSLGATSKLLTTSISERVSAKSKSAKHKFDKNLKYSKEKLEIWGSETSKTASKRLKNVRKSLPFQKEGKIKTVKYDDDERPQTLPPNDDMLNSIQFYSPLNCKTNNFRDLTESGEYEMPKSCKAINTPPSYDECMTTKSITDSDSSLSVNSSTNFHRNNNLTQSMFSSIGDDKNKILNRRPLTKNKSESNLYQIEQSSSDEEECLPPPTFPAPVFGNSETKSNKEEDIYGRIKQNTEPVHKTRIRRKNSYENHEIIANRIPSNRATIDPTEFVAERIYPKIFSRQFSPLPATTNKSESWQFYDTTVTDGNCSSPEPIYANDEPVYGKLYDDMGTDNLLQPSRYSRSKDYPVPGTSNQFNGNVEILEEFDPLGASTFKIETSNNLSILENILAEDTYGIYSSHENILADCQSLDLSDDEDNNNEIPSPPERIESLPIEPQPSSSKSVIIHQNSFLKQSMENLIDDAVIQPYLAQVDDSTTNQFVDLSRPSPSQSSWFVENSADVSIKNLNKNQKINSVNRNDSIKSVDKVVKSVPKLPHKTSSNDPPSYHEAVGSTHIKTKVSNAPPSPIDTKPPESPITQPKRSKSMFSNVFNKMEGMNFNLRRKNSIKSDNKSDTMTVLEMIAKPTISYTYISHEGHLIRLPSGVVEDILKELHSRRAMIRDKKFQTFMDSQHKVPKEHFPLEYITSIQCVVNNKFSNSTEMHCFEITTNVPKNQSPLSNPNMIMTNNNSGNAKTQRVCHVYGVLQKADRNIWMQKLIESLTDVFPKTLTTEYTRAGWCYLKNSITSEWSGAWILLLAHKRKLFFYNCAEMNLETIDLRKARCLVLKESDDSIKNLHVEHGPMLMIDSPPHSLYFIMTSPRETKIWRHIVKGIAHQNGASLKSQQLTKDNVPVIVDKCINFVYTHGSMTEGVYRKSGSESAIQKLISLFRADAFSVQITRTDYNEHDVANVLKRFMRELPERLLGKLSESFISVSKMKSKAEKIVAYKELLDRLPTIEKQTLRKLIGHLNFIQSQKTRNKMTVESLALSWGPTILQGKGESSDEYSHSEADVTADLIILYKNLYKLTKDEITKEHIMLEVLQKYHAAAENLSDSVKRSGDLKVWIKISNCSSSSDEEDHQINVSLTPTKNVNDVCKEIALKLKKDPRMLTLNEVILNGELWRPLHFNEKVLDTVLRWTYWPDSDRKDNYLEIRSSHFIEKVERALKNLPTVTPNTELKFADCKTRVVKPMTLELYDGKITIMKKEKNTEVKYKEIDLKDVIFYMGCEKKRDLKLMRWSMTIIENGFKKRTRDSPYIGHVVTGNNSNDQLVWFSSVLYSLHGNNVKPPPEIVL